MAREPAFPVLLVEVSGFAAVRVAAPQEKKVAPRAQLRNQPLTRVSAGQLRETFGLSPHTVRSEPKNHGRRGTDRGSGLEHDHLIGGGQRDRSAEPVLGSQR
jgi:hypothetical protein